MSNPTPDDRPSGEPHGRPHRDRVSTLNDAPIDPRAEYVLYWMTSARRRRWNHGLERAAHWAKELQKPLVILEALRLDYPYASERFHAFVIDGMRDNLEAFSDGRALYYPYVEPEPGAGSGLVEALAARACVVVGDDAPVFFLPRAVASAAGRVTVRFEAVDSNGLLPLRPFARDWKTAHSFRRHLQRELPKFLAEFPAEDPLVDLQPGTHPKLPDETAHRWPDAAELLQDRTPFERLTLDATVPALDARGGSVAGADVLKNFLSGGLGAYGTDRNHPDTGVTSSLSSYLHFGHVSTFEAFEAVTRREDWSPERLAEKPSGSREGWWGMSPAAESFLDQIVTWREVGYQCAAHFGAGYATYSTVPEWARRTLAEHEPDARTDLYSLEQLEGAETGDEVWNAAQRQLVIEGRIHNYLRMVWGKRVLEWTRTPAEAFEMLVYLNDRWALDGRDPNSYTGIGWVFGRHDRAWGPERPIFGKVRYMSSANTVRKLKCREYLARFGPASLK